MDGPTRPVTSFRPPGGRPVRCAHPTPGGLPLTDHRPTRVSLAALLVCLAPCHAVALRWQDVPIDASTACSQHPRIEGQGSLAWDTDGHSMPYDLTCPGVTFRSDPRTVTVRAATLTEALDAFAEDTFLLVYYADLKVRLGADGVLTADPIRVLTVRMLDEAFRTVITVTPVGGPTHILMQDGVIRPYPLPADRAVTVTIAAQGNPVPWPTVVLDASTGTVTATPSDPAN